MNITGKNVVADKLFAAGQESINAFSPILAADLPEQFYLATDDEIEQAVTAAHLAFKDYKNISAEKRARFLRAIAEEILNLDQELIERASLETGLPEQRLIGERGRTINQLNLFADIVEEGSWVEATIDTAQPERKPLPKPDLRKMLVATGPVVVFTASNFPLAFSTAGGDTASALAAGCPVIVKAHESHLGTNELVAIAIQQAAKKTNMPAGVFSSLNGKGYELGEKLVLHPIIKSVAFTGSRNGGMALYKLASQREEPIPVFSEMGSINPVLVFPESAGDNHELAAIIAGSMTREAGQYCTKPGLIILLSDKPESFLDNLSVSIKECEPQSMLNKDICSSYINKANKLSEQKNVSILAQNDTGADKTKLEANALLMCATSEEFIANPVLHEEVFGPASLVVICTNTTELQAVLNVLEAQLTMTVFATNNEVEKYADLINQITEKAGRVIFSGMPTGVEVCASMQHGGPFPATTDARFTSVGSDAIRRFARPICFQNWPATLLPEQLKDDNPLGLWRKINSESGKH